MKWFLITLGLILSVKANANSDSVVVVVVPSPDSARKAYGKMFSEILRAFPPESRSQVDSASIPRPSLNRPSNRELKNEKVTSSEGGRSKALENLPDEVRDRVEKAVKNMEVRGKKRLEFKDIKP